MNKYIVYFDTIDGLEEYGFLFEIDVSVNRTSQPTDEDLIFDYLNINYGNKVDYRSLRWAVLSGVVSIDEDYEVEV